MRRAVESIARSARVLVVADFDGTLAELADDPESVPMLDVCRQGLEALCVIDGVRCSVISGRGLSDLRRRLPSVPGLVVRGSHGAEKGEAGENVARERLLEDASHALESVVREHEGARIERKPMGLALHTRGMHPLEAQAAQRAASARLIRLRDLVELHGHDVIEFTLRGCDNKGLALREEREAFSVCAAFIVGDDVTDEKMFAQAQPGDVCVKVGEGRTLAPYRVASPHDVGALLLALAEARGATGARA